MNKTDWYELREAAWACREAEQGMQNRFEKFTPQELSEASESAKSAEEFRRLKEIALSQRETEDDSQTQSDGQNHGQSNPLGRGAFHDDDLEEKVKVKSKGMFR